jgi:hypothetical protein
MKNSTIFGLVSLLALSAVGILSNVATPALAAEKSADDKINKVYEIDDKINKVYEICDKVIGYYDDYKFGDVKTYKVYKLCESLVYGKPMYGAYDPYTHPTKTDKQ